MDGELEGTIGELGIDDPVFNDTAGQVLLAQTGLFQVLFVVGYVEVVLYTVDLRLRLFHPLYRVHYEFYLAEG